MKILVAIILMLVFLFAPQIEQMLNTSQSVKLAVILVAGFICFYKLGKASSNGRV